MTAPHLELERARVAAVSVVGPFGEWTSATDQGGSLPLDPQLWAQELGVSPRTHQSRTGALLERAVLLLEATIATRVRGVTSERFGIVLGSSTGGMDRTERAVVEAHRTGQVPPAYSFELSHAHHTLLDQLGERFPAGGPRYVVSTACSSGAKAIAAAGRLIATGCCDLVLTGGADALCLLTEAGFRSLGLWANSGCLPFTKARKGLKLGEGAAVLLLERPRPEGREAQQGTTIYFLGSGESNDAYDQSAPHPAGVGAELAMRKAVADAGLSIEDVDYVNAHGTGTPRNDSVESEAIARVFGPAACYSSTKHFTQHQLGAAGATEAAICVDALRLGKWPLNVGVPEPDPALPVSPLLASRKDHAKEVAISNSFAFGGSNACLVFSSRNVPPRTTLTRRFFIMSTSYWLESAKEATPPAELLPKRMRARSSPLAKLVAEVYSKLILGLSPTASPVHPEELALVLGSAFGELTTSLTLLGELAQDGIVSPLGFQASVHNTALGQLTQVLQNHGYATALASGHLSFTMGAIDALTYLAAHGGDAAVFGCDEAGPPLLLAGKTFPALGVGMLVRSGIDVPKGALAEILQIARASSEAQLPDFAAPDPMRPSEGSLRAAPAFSGLELLNSIKSFPGVQQASSSNSTWLSMGSGWAIELKLPST